MNREREDGRITIRVVTEADAGELLAIYRPYVEETAITFEYDVPTLEEFRGRIRNTLTKYPYFAAVKDGKILGYAYTGPFKGRRAYDWAAETTVYVAKEARRMGVGRLLYGALEEASQAQGIRNLYACIGMPIGEDDPYLTADSQQFHARLGYQLVGTFHKCGYKYGRWYDMIWMEKFLADHPDQPGEVIPFPEENRI